MLKFKFKPKKEMKRTLNKQKQIKRLPCELVRSITEAIPFKLTPGQTASNIYRFQSCLMFGLLVRLVGFTKPGRPAHVYYEADFDPTHPRWLLIGSVLNFDGLFDTRLSTS